MKVQDSLTVEDISKCNLNSPSLNGVMNFLYHSDKIISKSNNKYSLTSYGKEWLFTDPVLAMSFGVVGAYSPF